MANNLSYSSAHFWNENACTLTNPMLTFRNVKVTDRYVANMFIMNLIKITRYQKEQ